ncbi:MAG: hypothetical protein WAU65_01030 [Candidatus Nanoarchaeia archaeon]
MDKKILIVSLIFSILLVLFLSIIMINQVITIYDAHATFEGYCHWRSLEIVNESNNYGYCNNSLGQVYKMVLVNRRWYLDGDLPNNWPF